MSEANKAIARRWFDEAYNQGNLAIADTIFSPDFTWNGQQVGPTMPQANVRGFRAAFPDITATIEWQIAEGQWVVTHWTARGTHQGTFNGIAPTSNYIVMPVIVIWRFVDGHVVEDWTTWDRLALLQQLGAASVG